jgi:hypothetical protein
MYHLMSGPVRRSVRFSRSILRYRVKRGYTQTKKCQHAGGDEHEKRGKMRRKTKSQVSRNTYHGDVTCCLGLPGVGGLC